MTTNKSEIVAWRWRKPVVNDQGETVGFTDWNLSETPEFLPWWPNEPLVRLSDYEALQAECDALRAKTSLSLGVGDGTGNLFVYGDCESINHVLALIFECERLRRGVVSLVEALELISDTDPDDETARFHDIAHKALEAYRKGGE